MESHFLASPRRPVALLIAALAGAGRHIEPGTALATAQVGVTGLLQLCHGLFCLVLWPATDKMMAFMQGTQYCCEFVRTALLILALGAEEETAASLQQSSFVISLLALAVPLICKGYDAIVVQAITLHNNGKLNRRAAGISIIMFVVELQSAIMHLTGFAGASEARTAGSLTETSAKIAKRGADQGIVVEIVDALAGVTTDLFALQWGNASDDEHKAATKIQTAARGRLARRRAYRVRTFGLAYAESRPGFGWLARELGAEEIDEAKRRRKLLPLPPGLPPLVVPSIALPFTRTTSIYPVDPASSQHSPAAREGSRQGSRRQQKLAEESASVGRSGGRRGSVTREDDANDDLDLDVND